MNIFKQKQQNSLHDKIDQCLCLIHGKCAHHMGTINIGHPSKCGHECTIYNVLSSNDQMNWNKFAGKFSLFVRRWKYADWVNKGETEKNNNIVLLHQKWAQSVLNSWVVWLLFPWIGNKDVVVFVVGGGGVDVVVVELPVVLVATAVPFNWFVLDIASNTLGRESILRKPLLRPTKSSNLT